MSIRAVPTILHRDLYRVGNWLEEVQRSLDRGHIEDLEAYELEEMGIWKDGVGVAHEMVVAKFRERELGHTVGLVVEREDNAWQSSPLPVSPSSSQEFLSDEVSKASPSPEALTSDLVWVFPTCPSCDYLVNYVGRNERKRENAKYRCVRQVFRRATSGPEQTVPNLIQFTYATATAWITEARYTVAQNNCRWFCKAIVYALAQRFDTIEFMPASNYEFGGVAIPAGDLLPRQLRQLTEGYDRHMQRYHHAVHRLQLQQLLQQAEAERAEAQV